MGNLGNLSPTAAKVYEIIARRFLAIFFPPAIYRKISLNVSVKGEQFFAGFKVLESEGYLEAAAFSFAKKRQVKEETPKNGEVAEDGEESGADQEFMEALNHLKKGMELPVRDMQIKEGETSPPKRYNSGTIILAMENAGQLIEDEELRSHIKEAESELRQPERRS